MKTITLIARFLLGIGFVVFGVNGFLNFLPMPALPEDGAQFLGLMATSGGYLKVVKVLEIAGGLLLLTGRYLALGLTILGPIVVNILLFHIAFDPPGIALGAVFAAVWAFLMWRHWGNFNGIFDAPRARH